MTLLETEPTLRQTVTRSTWPERIAAGTAGAAAIALTFYLLPHWHESAELSHGWFAPLFAVVLLSHSRREDDWAAAWPGAAVSAVQVLLTVTGAALAGIAALSALVQGATHSQPVFLAGVTVAVILASGVLALSRAPSQLVRFNGASVCAALLWCLVVPLPSGTLARFTLLLQDIITAASVETLHFLGVAAVRHGNVIQLATGLVGVEEACSGIRSLTACVFAGVVLGGLMLTGIARRVGLVIGAALLAFVANLTRSLFLCILAAQGVDIGGFWHDATGHAVLGGTAIVLLATCVLLSRKAHVSTPSPRHVTAVSPRPFFAHGVLVGFAALCLLGVIVRLSPAPRQERRPPDLQSIATIDAEGWFRRSDESVFAFSKALNTSFLSQQTYLRGDTQVTFYIAFWPSYQSTLGSVALHTPDICLPGSGWKVLPTPPPVSEYPLPGPQRFLLDKEGYPQHVWFWHLFDRQVVGERAGVYPWQLAPALFKQGIHARAPQCVIRVSSNRPLESLVEEPLVREFFRRLELAELAPQR